MSWPTTPNPGDIVVLQGIAIVITSVDRHKMEGTFKLFATEKEALDWCHDSSLASFPEWHHEQCPKCKASESSKEEGKS